jgi:hypothetical protein
VDERVWRLPGPRGFVRDVVAEHRRGRHVATVLPQALASDAIFTDSLAVALLEEFTNQSVAARRIYHTDGSRSIMETFCQALIFDNLPATVPDLLSHPEASEVVAVVVAGDLCPSDRCELPRFLHRVERESHTGDPTRRLSIVVILARGQLPVFVGGASSDVALTSIWWWDRVARWDVAAHIADLPQRGDLTGVLEDVRSEAVVEVARWDLDLAEQLAATWSGEPNDLPSLLTGWRAVPAPAISTRHLNGDTLRPPDLLLESWDKRAVDSWHHYQCVAGCSLATEPEKLGRVVWAAQARVLLPWIEERRSTLHSRIAETLGAQRFASILHDRFDPPIKAGSFVEIGALDRVVRMTIGSTDVELRDSARRLRDARNSLAHMQPLSLGAQMNLLAACRWLL